MEQSNHYTIYGLLSKTNFNYFSSNNSLSYDNNQFFNIISIFNKEEIKNVHFPFVISITHIDDIPSNGGLLITQTISQDLNYDIFKEHNIIFHQEDIDIEFSLLTQDSMLLQYNLIQLMSKKLYITKSIFSILSITHDEEYDSDVYLFQNFEMDCLIDHFIFKDNEININLIYILSKQHITEAESDYNIKYNVRKEILLPISLEVDGEIISSRSFTTPMGLILYIPDILKEFTISFVLIGENIYHREMSFTTLFELTGESLYHRELQVDLSYSIYREGITLREMSFTTLFELTTPIIDHIEKSFTLSYDIIKEIIYNRELQFNILFDIDILPINRIKQIDFEYILQTSEGIIYHREQQIEFYHYNIKESEKQFNITFDLLEPHQRIINFKINELNIFNNERQISYHFIIDYVKEVYIKEIQTPLLLTSILEKELFIKNSLIQNIEKEYYIFTKTINFREKEILIKFSPPLDYKNLISTKFLTITNRLDVAKRKRLQDVVYFYNYDFDSVQEVTNTFIQIIPETLEFLSIQYNHQQIPQEFINNFNGNNYYFIELPNSSNSLMLLLSKNDPLDETIDTSNLINNLPYCTHIMNKSIVRVTINGVLQELWQYSSNEQYPQYFSFNKNNNNFWRSQNLSNINNQRNPLFIQYRFGNSQNQKKINSFNLTQVNDESYNPPKSMILQQSNDGQRWIDIQSFSIENWEQGETKNFTFYNNQLYTHYRIRIVEILFTDKNYVDILDINFYHNPITTTDVIEGYGRPLMDYFEPSYKFKMGKPALYREKEYNITFEILPYNEIGFQFPYLTNTLKEKDLLYNSLFIKEKEQMFILELEKLQIIRTIDISTILINVYNIEFNFKMFIPLLNDKVDQIEKLLPYQIVTNIEEKELFEFNFFIQDYGEIDFSIVFKNIKTKEIPINMIQINHYTNDYYFDYIFELQIINSIDFTINLHSIQFLRGFDFTYHYLFIKESKTETNLFIPLIKNKEMDNEIYHNLVKEQSIDFNCYFIIEKEIKTSIPFYNINQFINIKSFDYPITIMYPQELQFSYTYDWQYGRLKTIHLTTTTFAPYFFMTLIELPYIIKLNEFNFTILSNHIKEKDFNFNYTFDHQYVREFPYHLYNYTITEKEFNFNLIELIYIINKDFNFNQYDLKIMEKEFYLPIIYEQQYIRDIPTKIYNCISIEKEFNFNYYYLTITEKEFNQNYHFIPQLVRTLQYQLDHIIQFVIKKLYDLIIVNIKYKEMSFNISNRIIFENIQKSINMEFILQFYQEDSIPLFNLNIKNIEHQYNLNSLFNKKYQIQFNITSINIFEFESYFDYMFELQYYIEIPVLIKNTNIKLYEIILNMKSILHHFYVKEINVSFEQQYYRSMNVSIHNTNVLLPPPLIFLQFTEIIFTSLKEKLINYSIFKINELSYPINFDITDYNAINAIVNFNTFKNYKKSFNLLNLCVKESIMQISTPFELLRSISFVYPVSISKIQTEVHQSLIQFNKIQNYKNNYFLNLNSIKLTILKLKIIQPLIKPKLSQLQVQFEIQNYGEINTELNLNYLIKLNVLENSFNLLNTKVKYHSNIIQFDVKPFTHKYLYKNFYFIIVHHYSKNVCIPFNCVSNNSIQKLIHNYITKKRNISINLFVGSPQKTEITNIQFPFTLFYCRSIKKLF